MEGIHHVDWNDKENGKWALRKAAKRQKLNNSLPKSSAELIYRTDKGEFKVANGHLKFNMPLEAKTVQNSIPSKRPRPKTIPTKSRKRGFDLIDFSAEEASSDEETSSEVEIPESLSSDGNVDQDDVPSLESLPE